MVNKLVHTSVIGTNMSFGKLPLPICSCIHRRSNYTFSSETWSEAKLYSNRLESAKRYQEKYGAGSIGFSPIKGIDPVKKWNIDIALLYHKQLIFHYCLLHGHAIKLS